MDALTLVTGVVSVLSPYLVKVGEKAAEEVGKKLPEGAARVWNTLITKFKGKAAAEEAGTDFVAKPDNEDYRAAFRKELRKMLEDDPAFVTELANLLKDAKRQSGATISNTGSGAVATSGGVAAGAAGVAVRGDVQGGINMGVSERKA